MSNVVDIKDVSKSYGDIHALQNVSLSVEEGEMFGLIGPDGAGKSTLYRLLATLLVPDRGSLTMLGLDTVRDYRKLRNLIGYMPERFSLYPEFFRVAIRRVGKKELRPDCTCFQSVIPFPQSSGGKTLRRDEAETGTELCADSPSARSSS